MIQNHRLFHFCQLLNIFIFNDYSNIINKMQIKEQKIFSYLKILKCKGD